jgi:positive regulator of sigma E activity
MIWIIIVLLVWIIGGFIAYNKYINKWEDKSKGEKVYFSVIWPLLLPLYLIHWIHNNC